MRGEQSRCELTWLGVVNAARTIERHVDSGNFSELATDLHDSMSSLVDYLAEIGGALAAINEPVEE